MTPFHRCRGSKVQPIIPRAAPGRARNFKRKCPIASFCSRIAETLAHFSRWYTFVPGDVLSTGTPAGVGYGRDPKVFLQDGDIVEVEVSGIGILRNRFVAATAPR